jgi:hypothetical protein
MPDTATPEDVVQRLIPKSTGDNFLATLSTTHALIFDQILALGLTVKFRLTTPAADQPDIAGRSIDAADYAACALVRAIRDLSLAAERIIAHAPRAADWQYNNPFATAPGGHFHTMAEAVARRGLAPARTIAAPQSETGEPGTDANTVPFPSRRAKH